MLVLGMDNNCVRNNRGWCGITSNGPSLSIIFNLFGSQVFDTLYTEFYTCVYMICPIDFILYINCRELNKKCFMVNPLY